MHDGALPGQPCAAWGRGASSFTNDQGKGCPAKCQVHGFSHLFGHPDSQRLLTLLEGADAPGMSRQMNSQQQSGLMRLYARRLVQACWQASERSPLPAAVAVPAAGMMNRPSLRAQAPWRALPDPRQKRSRRRSISRLGT